MRPAIAIIDSGVNPRHPHVHGVAAGRCFVPGEARDAYLDFIGHGTAVAGAICEKVEAVELYIAKVFHRQLVTSIDVLLEALDWCLEQPVSLINLSLATANEGHRAAFEARVSRAVAAGIRIVSPAAKLPGCLEGVAGVTLDDSVPRFVVGPGFTACGWPRPIPGVPQERNLYGISFAVANVTGCLARDAAANEKARSIENG
jgi:subtilisin family serine protease